MIITNSTGIITSLIFYIIIFVLIIFRNNNITSYLLGVVGDVKESLSSSGLSALTLCQNGTVRQIDGNRNEDRKKVIEEYSGRQSWNGADRVRLIGREFDDEKESKIDEMEEEKERFIHACIETSSRKHVHVHPNTGTHKHTHACMFA